MLTISIFLQISLPEKPFKPDSLLKERLTKGETCIYIKHSKKVVQSGNSTVIYLTHNDEQYKSISKIYEVHTNICTKCKQKLENNNDNTIKKTHCIEEDMTPDDSVSKRDKHSCAVTNLQKMFPLCKSENDLVDVKTDPKAVKERSKLTASTFTRRNTFIDGASQSLKTLDFEGRLKNKNVFIPNHIPVRTYVKNIECNRNN